MKKLSILMGALFLLFMAVPVMAQELPQGDYEINKSLDVNVDLDVRIEDAFDIDFYKEKKIDILETITKDKNVDLDVIVFLETDKAAESMAVVKGVIDNAYSCENCSEKWADIINSINDNQGIMNFNQASGHINNQGNVTSIAVDRQPATEEEVGEIKGYAEAQADVQQAIILSESFTEDTIPLRAVIDGSILRNKGIVNVNQTVGNMNNQHNVNSIAASLYAGVALADAELSQVVTMARAEDYNVNRIVLLEGSMNENRGIVNVNQNSGTLNSQANVVSIAVAINVPPATP